MGERGRLTTFSEVILEPSKFTKVPLGAGGIHKISLGCAHPQRGALEPKSKTVVVVAASISEGFAGT